MDVLDRQLLGLDGRKTLGEMTERDLDFSKRLSEFYAQVASAAMASHELAVWVLEETGAVTIGDLSPEVQAALNPIMEHLMAAADLARDLADH